MTTHQLRRNFPVPATVRNGDLVQVVTKRESIWLQVHSAALNMAYCIVHSTPLHTDVHGINHADVLNVPFDAILSVIPQDREL